MRRRMLITMATGIQCELQMPDLVAGSQLTQAFQPSGKTKRPLQEQGTGRQFHIRQAPSVAGDEERLDFRLKLNDLLVVIGTAKTRHHNVEPGRFYRRRAN